MKNKYAKRARISEAKIREIVRDVAADLTALQAAALSGLHRNTVNRLSRDVRERMLLACEAQRRLFGVVEVDERFFGARRVTSRRGRGAYGKTVVFGIFARQGHVYTEIVPDCSKPTLQGIIRGRVDPRTVINSDGWRGYHGRVDLGYGHVRVDHARDEFTTGTVHINGIAGLAAPVFEPPDPGGPDVVGDRDGRRLHAGIALAEAAVAQIHRIGASGSSCVDVPRRRTMNRLSSTRAFRKTR